MNDKLFWDEEFVASRLLGSIVMYKGEPVNVFDIRKGPNSILVECNTASKEGLIAPVDKLDWRKFNVGNLNKTGRSYHISRVAARQWKLGLNAGNIMATNFLHVQYGDFVLTKALRKMMLNEYPSIEEIIEKLKKNEKHSGAFCSDYSLYKPTGGVFPLIRREHEDVGVLSINKPELKEKAIIFNSPFGWVCLWENFFYLKEEVEECLGM